MTRRTSKEIEMDCRRIKNASKTATSMKELEKATGLTYAMIKTTLSKHPIILKRIKEQIESNHQSMENAKLEVQKQIQRKNNQNETIETKKDISGFVIDASITGIGNLKEHLLKICNTQAKIIITSITIKELEKLQQFDDIYGKDARNILAMAAENHDNFESVLIDETLDTPDDCIIKYCADNKDKVTLLTSDKTMALKARMYSIQVHYFKQSQKEISSKTTIISKSNIRTLIPAKKIGSSLLISNFHTSTLSIRVCSNGLEFNDGIKELKIGDDVFVASKKIDYITFAHYNVISLYAENNCKLIFSKRIYDYTNVDLPKASYKSFIKDFLHRHDLI